MNPSERQVVITGAGILTPLGCDLAEVFEAVCRGRSATGLDAPFDVGDFPAGVVGVLPADTDLLTGMRKDQARYLRKNTKVMSRDTQVAVASASRAILDAALPPGEVGKDSVLPTLDHTRLGTVYGAGFIPAEIDEFGPTTAASMDADGQVLLSKWGAEGIPLMFPLWLLKFLPNMLSCHIGIIWDCQGPSNAITCDEAAGLLAVGEAFRHVARGTADVMLSGGAESKVNPSSMLRVTLLGNAGTRHNDRPESAHRPFDADRDGCVCAEGAATVIVEAADHAAARCVAPKARVAGFASACATTPPNVPETSGAAIARTIRAALNDAACRPADIDAVIAHGVAVPGQDVAEAAAIREVLGDVPVTSFAGGMGNVGVAHGPVDVALACEMLARDTVPPIRNCETLDGRCPISAVMGACLEKPLRRVVVLSSAIAAQAGALVLEKV